MGTFKTAVQADDVSGPLRQRFSKQRWHAAYTRLGTDEDDVALYEAGLLVHDKAARIRSKLSLTQSNDIRATTKVRTFAAMVNFQMVEIVRQTENAFHDLAAEHAAKHPGMPVLMHEMANVRLDAGFGQAFTADELFQSIVDGVEIPLKVILGSSPDLSGNAELGKVDLGQAHVEYQLAGLYSQLEDLWDDCLWNGYAARQEKRGVVFSCPDATWSIREVSSRTRANMLHQQSSFAARSHCHQLMKRGALEGLGRIDVKAVARVGRRQVLRMGPLEGDSLTAAWLFTLRSLASEPYYDELLEEPQALLQSATLDQLLVAWSVVSNVASLLRKRVRTRIDTASDDPKTCLQGCAPVVQIRALVEAIAVACKVNLKSSQALLDFLVFRGAADQELWAQPLVPVSAEAVIPIFATLTSPNLRRLLDVWLKQLGVDLAKRGPAFERHVRQRLSEDMAASPLLGPLARCHPEGLRFTPAGGQEEEIDVVGLIGPVVLVGEVKCLREPAEPKEVARHRQKVIQAVAQAKRKADAVRSHLDAFRRRAAQAGLDVPSDAQVFPLVVLNSALHCGIAIDGVPVVDEHILRVVLEGELQELAVTDPDGDDFQPLRKRVFFATLAEGIDKLPDLLAYPPQMIPLLKGMRARWIPVAATDADDWAGTFQAWECVPEIDKTSLTRDVAT